MRAVASMRSVKSGVLTAVLSAALLLLSGVATAFNGDDPIEHAVAATAEMTRDRTDRNPSEALVYTTKRSVALEAMDAGRMPQATDERVYLVTYVGDFTLKAFHGPAGASAPQGKMLTYVVRAATGEILDTGLVHRTKDFSGSLGPPRRVRV